MTVNKKDVIKFRTLSGTLTAVRAGKWIKLDFPARVTKPAAAPAGLARALGKKPLALYRSGPYYIAEFRNEKIVRAIAPDFEALRRLPMLDIAVTAPGGGKPYDFVSRLFAPAEGVNEDPVTGSAHCGLAPYWAAKLGKKEFLARQVSKRGGTLRLSLCGDRVIIRGQAVTVFSGEMRA